MIYFTFKGRNHLPQVERTEAKTQVTPASIKIVLTFQELIGMIRKEVPDLPEGGLFEVKVNPDTERVTIFHT